MKRVESSCISGSRSARSEASDRGTLTDDPIRMSMGVRYARMNQPEDAQRIEYRNDWKGDAQPREWICEGWLNYRLTLFTGHGGTGKSQLALQLAAAVSSKVRCNWIPLDPGASDAVLTISSSSPVLVASWEDEYDEVHRRLSSIAKVLPWAASDQIENRLHFADLADHGPLWDAKLTGVGERLQATANDVGARLLIIDPRAAAYAGDENHRAQVRAFISHWDRWARDNRCAVLLIDHLPKYATTDGSYMLRGGATYAGSTDWHNASRCVWNIDEKYLLRCDKSNYGDTPPPVRLRALAKIICSLGEV